MLTWRSMNSSWVYRTCVQSQVYWVPEPGSALPVTVMVPDLASTRSCKGNVSDKCRDRCWLLSLMRGVEKTNPNSRTLNIQS